MKKQQDLGLILLRRIKSDPPKSTKRTPIAWSDKLTTKYLNDLVKTDSKNIKVPEHDVHRAAFDYAVSINDGKNILIEET